MDAGSISRDVYICPEWIGIYEIKTTSIHTFGKSMEEKKSKGNHKNVGIFICSVHVQSLKAGAHLIVLPKWKGRREL